MLSFFTISQDKQIKNYKSATGAIKISSQDIYSDPMKFLTLDKSFVRAFQASQTKETNDILFYCEDGISYNSSDDKTTINGT